ncbi:uncharacterized protein LOC112501797 [Cynara cardunculus var. scolymus]|uniref:Uncharacterized protein n=1 Tax=Cynara cardunculus var. scolymus TaxID=59895 RepID=A0A103XDE5_CYNCS|nr:uncharacterized protein LOC112501797 [Cynara cardunculus var. scolymus]KVH88693.1 hypothetical protein Ccrd_026054 [Cynara cardunculus var. scolymus]
MASGAAGDGIFGNVFGGCISSDDIGIQRRPYHRNCNCALHRSDENHCTHAPLPKVSYPIRRSWSEGCLVAMMASAGPSPGSSPCCPSSPAPTAPSAARLPPHIPNHQLNH